VGRATLVVLVAGLMAFIVIMVSVSGPTADGTAGIIGAFVGVASLIVATLLMFEAMARRTYQRRAIAVWVTGMILAPAAMLVAFTPVPRTVRFELSRGSFDAAAQAALTGSRTPTTGWIGLYPVVQVIRVATTRVEFDLSTDEEGYPTGFIYIVGSALYHPNVTDPAVYDRLGEYLGGAWWTVFDPTD
jgi:hypothetical protein